MRPKACAKCTIVFYGVLNAQPHELNGKYYCGGCLYKDGADFGWSHLSRSDKRNYNALGSKTCNRCNTDIRNAIRRWYDDMIVCNPCYVTLISDRNTSQCL